MSNLFAFWLAASAACPTFFSVRPEPVEGLVPSALTLRRAQRERKVNFFQSSLLVA
jgi:hypothetical protein